MTAVNLMKIKCSLNFQWVGKTEKRMVDKKPAQFYNGKKVYLGYYWKNVEIEVEDLFEFLAVEGVPVAPWLKEEADGNRKDINFESHQIALVDIDEGMMIQELLENEFYNLFGGGFYTSPSHTDENHKFRILFVLESPITDVDDMRHLYRGLMMVFKDADGACKDGARLFNGTINADVRDFTGQTLPDSIVKKLIRDSRLEDELKYRDIDPNRTYEEQTDEDKKKTIELLKTIYLGDYEKWRVVGWALRNSGYTLEDFVEVTLGGMMRQKSRGECLTIWEYGVNRDTSFGYIVNLLKEHGKYNNNKQKAMNALLEL